MIASQSMDDTMQQVTPLSNYKLNGDRFNGCFKMPRSRSRHLVPECIFWSRDSGRLIAAVEDREGWDREPASHFVVR
jgi:hypothetical protein